VFVGRKGVILVAELPADASPGVSTLATAVQCIANRPIVSHVLDVLCAAGAEETIVVVPEKWRCDVHACLAATSPSDAQIHYVIHEEGEAPSDVLGRVTDLVGDAACIVHLADGLLAQPLAPIAESLDETASDLLLLLQPATTTTERLGSAARELLRVSEFDPAKTSLGCAGVFLAGGGALQRACAGEWVADGRLDLHAITESVARAGRSLDAQVVHGWRRYIGDASDLLELNRVTLDALAPDFGAVELEENRIEGRVVIHPTAWISRSSIIGPVIVGARAHVTDAYVGPYTSIGSGVRIEGVEVERSIISPGASITHLDGRLVESVVGCDARIFRDFSLPRATRLAVGNHAEVAFS